MTKNFAPAAERNKQPIASALASILPERGFVLEVASGTGQHVAHFAALFPTLTWQPSDVDPAQLDSVRAYVREAGVGNVLDPVVLDASSDAWPVAHADVIFSANMVHIAPWEACLGLLAGAGRILPVGGSLVTYGPYSIDGGMVDSNVAFDHRLRAMNAEWGVRELADIDAAAAGHGMSRIHLVPMPANNYCAVWRKA